MNSFERVTAAFGGHAVDRIPFAVWRHFYPDEHEVAAKLAETTMKATAAPMIHQRRRMTNRARTRIARLRPDRR